jgi:serine/threonine-protein kinase RIO1
MALYYPLNISRIILNYLQLVNMCKDLAIWNLLYTEESIHIIDDGEARREKQERLQLTLSRDMNREVIGSAGQACTNKCICG